MPSNLNLRLSANGFILLTALFISLFLNFSFYSHAVALYSMTAENLLFLFAIFFFQLLITTLFLTLFGFRPVLRPLLIVLLILSSAMAYFMDRFGILINEDMIRNVVQTQVSEASDLFTFKLVLYVFLLGLLPGWILYRSTDVRYAFKAELISRIKLILITLTLLILTIFIFYKPFASFFREHKTVRFYSNPIYPVYSLVKFGHSQLKSARQPLQPLGTDARIVKTTGNRKLVIFVVGETARADHFALNGYTRNTTPLLSKEKLFNFKHMTSCGTSTAISVPCMFSILGVDDFSNADADATENVLDILNRAGVNVLWRDNNSSSKGVAERITQQNYRSPDSNTICDTECRDIGMLADLQDYIDSKQDGDILIVLHSMGNHGPAYYKRYTSDFEVFKPSCKTAQLEDCPLQDIINAYDNAIVYTDYFLSQTIQFLKQNSDDFETSLMYASDHGESLGENGVFLHGLPNFIAPEAQTRVPGFLWFSDNFQNLDIPAITRKTGSELSHDNLFHTLLGLFEVQTSVYDKSSDILAADE